jgi:cell fate regulator YaaT (PSP1 superfamily)
MQLVRVERYFDGSKIIFYFTAESRVDFRELVKRLVNDFRTRVEMRQIGVRHEAQMLGGLGPCGREFCCTSFLKKFGSVSIKMAKAQDLPLNPAKISGVCNRLFCCLSYEYDSYRLMKQGMPRVGRLIRFEGVVYRVIRQLALQGNVIAISEDREERIFTEDEWQTFEPLPKSKTKPKPKQKRKRIGRRSDKKDQEDTKGKKN